MTQTEAKKKVRNDPDYINLKRFNYSLKELLERYPEGAPDRLIAQALMMSEDELESLYNSIVLKLRNAMNVTIL